MLRGTRRERTRPRATLPFGVFYPAVLVGDLAYVSGQVPRNTVRVGMNTKSQKDESTTRRQRRPSDYASRTSPRMFLNP